MNPQTGIANGWRDVWHRYASLAEEEAKDRQTEAEAHIQTAQKLQVVSQELELLVQDKRARVSSQGMA